MIINFRVEYEPSVIRHVAVQCPNCRRWYRAYDILQKGELHYGYDLNYAEFVCPVCTLDFSGYDPGSGFETIKIDECGDVEEVYQECLTKREVWE